jgi:hypothetical protein
MSDIFDKNTAVWFEIPAADFGSWQNVIASNAAISV